MALYLPAIDLLAEGWIGGDVALADLVRAELEEADRLIGGLMEGFGTLVVVLDPGRRRGGRAGWAGRGGFSLLIRRRIRARSAGAEPICRWLPRRSPPP